MHACYKQAELHLLDVTLERSVYKDALEKAKASVIPHFTSNDTFSPPPPHALRPANTTPVFAHYRFDMGQQVFYTRKIMESDMPIKVHIYYPYSIIEVMLQVMRCGFLEYVTLHIHLPLDSCRL